MLALRFSDTTDCYFRVHKIDDYMPIPIVANSSRPTIPRMDDNGYLYLKQDEEMELTCGDHPFHRPCAPTVSHITIKCLNRTFVEYNGNAYKFKQFICKRRPVPKLRVTDKHCQRLETTNIVEVGFSLKYNSEDKANQFLTLYKVCYMTKYKHAMYAWHMVKPPFLHGFQQQPDHKQDFLSNNFKGRGDMAKVYERQVSSGKPSRVMMLRSLADTRSRYVKYIGLAVF